MNIFNEKTVAALDKKIRRNESVCRGSHKIMAYFERENTT